MEEEEEKIYICQDEDCGRFIKESQRLEMQNSLGNLIYKCPYCRGRLEETNYSTIPVEDKGEEGNELRNI